MSQNDKQRDIKRPYRKKAFQTGYSLVTETADSTPRPLSSYSTTEDIDADRGGEVGASTNYFWVGPQGSSSGCNNIRITITYPTT